MLCRCEVLAVAGFPCGGTERWPASENAVRDLMTPSKVQLEEAAPRFSLSLREWWGGKRQRDHQGTMERREGREAMTREENQVKESKSIDTNAGIGI